MHVWLPCCQGFLQTDEELLKQCAAKTWQDGATAVAVWLIGNTALVANVGDAKCVLARELEKVGTMLLPTQFHHEYDHHA
jgi:serine/threonine protein phosphatase PrpC